MFADKEKITSLVRAAQAGDGPAFAELVRSYQDIAVAYAAAILGDYHLAEDAAQEAFVEAYRKLPSLREPAAFAGWFRTIIFKYCDRVTRRKRPPITNLDAALEVASPEPSPHEILESQDTAMSIREAIAALPDAERQVVLLYYMGDHSHAAIAKFLEVTPNTVKTRLYSARQRLRKHMKHIEENLQVERPSRDPKFAEKVQRMIQPEALKTNKPLTWSPGMGTDVWEMFCAAIIGDLETIKRLVDKDPSLVRCHYAYRTPLYFAVRENQVEVAAYLLEHGADPISLAVNDSFLDITRDRGYGEMQKLLEAHLANALGASPKGTTIAAAIRERDLAKVRSLLDAAPELLHAGDERGNQPIHWAVMTRQIDMIDELLARGAAINAKRSGGARPIQLTNGDYHYRGWRDVPKEVTTTPAEVLAHLRARGAYVDICTAAHTGDLNRVRELLDEDPSLANRVSEYGTYYLGSGAPLKNAAAKGHIEIVKLLLERGADPNLPEEGIAPHGHALYAAVSNGHFEIAKLLLEHGAYPNPEVESSADALSIALINKDEKMVELLCSYGAARAVHHLAYYGDVQTAAAVFAANPALADDPEALTYAAGEGQEAFVRLLLRYQPELPKRINFPSWSVGAKTRELNELLFKHGMNPSQPDWLRATPLHHFAGKGDVENAALFIDHGADLHARDEDICSTPLGWAAKFGKRLMVEFLLRRGGKLNLPDDPPWATPLSWATRRGHRQIVELLKQYEQTGALPARPIEHYETLARDFVEAYNSGDAVALQRLNDYYQPERTPNLDPFRAGVRERLGRPSKSENGNGDLALAEAQLLVARSHGFESWVELVKHTETT
jgi:RNA polymerase sigma factor (sigma-70 family)